MSKEWLELLNTKALLDTKESIAGDFLEQFEYPWEALPYIKDEIIKIGSMLLLDEYEQRGKDIWISKTAVIAPTAYISGPVIIDHKAEVRHCAFIRGNAVIGRECVVGNSTELKNVILFNKVQVPHFNYVGDSILGYMAHMGAGSITSNIKSDKSPVTLKIGDEKLETGLKKFGAILGDNTEIGCNSVLNPGTVVGRSSSIYPLSMVRGYVPQNCIFKSPQNIVKKL